MTSRSGGLTVSVITATFNSEVTVARALRSVAEQSWPNIEHIVIDGGSTDSTADIVRRSPHVAHFASAPDRGIYDAMNKGIAAATGDVIGFLNSDDFFADRNVLRSVAEAMEPDVDAVFGDVTYFRPSRPDGVVRRYRSDRFEPSRLSRGFMPAHPTLYARREVFERVGSFSTDYRIAGDFEWAARVFRDGTARYRYLPLVFVRMQTGGASTRGLRDGLLVNREILRACRINGIRTSWPRVLSRYPEKLLELL